MRYLLLLLITSLISSCSSLSALVHPPFSGCKDMCGKERALSCKANEWGVDCICKENNYGQD